MFDTAIIRTINSEHIISGKDVYRYDLEYTPNVARFDFKDLSFTEFTRSNIVSITIKHGTSERGENEQE